MLDSLTPLEQAHALSPFHFSGRAAWVAAAAQQSASERRGEEADGAHAAASTAALNDVLGARWAAESRVSEEAQDAARRLDAAAFELLTSASGALSEEDEDEALQMLRAATALDPANRFVALYVVAWTLQQRGDPLTPSVHVNHLNSALLRPEWWSAYRAGLQPAGTVPMPSVLSCWTFMLPASVLPPLPGVADGTANETALEERIVDALDAVGPRAALLEIEQVPEPMRATAEFCSEVGSPIFDWAYAARPQLAVQRALQQMLYRAFGASLEYVAPHLRGLYADRRGEVLWAGRRMKAARCRVDREAVAGLVHLTNPRERIRLAVVTGTMYAGHPVLKCFGDVFARLNNDKFDVAVFWVARDQQPDAVRLRRYGTDVTVNTISGLSLAQQRATVAGWHPHVVVYTDLGMGGSTDERLAMGRLAPNQVLMTGHPVTSGLRTVDVFLATEDANAVAERHFSEAEYVPLRSVGSLRSDLTGIQESRCRRSRFGLPYEARLYVCAQALHKVHVSMDRAILSILERDEDAFVVFIAMRGKPTYARRLLRRFAATIPARALERVTVLPTIGDDYDLNYDFLELVQCGDVVLDTFPFSGGTSSLESLALSMPVVTLPGPDVRGRHTLKYYHHINLYELIAETEVSCAKHGIGRQAKR